MITLKEKSEISINSACVLTSSEDTCLTSVHCAYYSCYQLILYYLDKTFSYSACKRKEEYDNYLRAANKTHLGSHEFWIKKFVGCLASKSFSNSIAIDKNLRLLRQNRLEADYQEVEFSKKDTDKLYDTACQTIGLINKSLA